MSLPQVPVIADAFKNLFGVIDAMIAQAKAKAEIEAPGSGRVFDDLSVKVHELEGKLNVPAIAADFVKVIADALRNGSLVVSDGTDLVR